jgi:Asp-tRNA(Asn)/Glu-tRNA(Gln) amidotransferase A subunit family amidase
VSAISELERLSLRAAVERLRAGELTCVDYTAALLARTGSLEQTLHAFAWLDRGHALAAARAADALRAAGTKPGRLHGVPIGVKDIFATAGIPTGMGSPAFAGFVPEKSAAMVVRAEAQCFTFGKTVTAELAYSRPGRPQPGTRHTHPAARRWARRPQSRPACCRCIRHPDNGSVIRRGVLRLCRVQAG